MSTVPIFSPDGSLGDIPSEQLAAAVQAGAKPGVNIISPDGKPGVVPADRYVDAVKAGARVAPFANQEIKHPGFWTQLYNDVKSAGPALLQSASAALVPAGMSPLTGAPAMRNAVAQSAAQIPANFEKRTTAGESLAYRMGAAAAEATGTNVSGMEQSAQQGDVGGVLGHAAAVPAIMAASYGAARAAPMAAEMGPPLVRGAAKTYNVARNAAVAVAPVAGAAEAVARLLHGDPNGALVSAFSGGVLGETARRLPAASPRLTDYGNPPPTYPGAFLPANPAPELLQAAPLAQGGAAPPPEPAAGLGNIPVSQQPAPVYPGATLPASPSPELLQGRVLSEGGVTPSPSPSAGLGNIPPSKPAVAPTPPDTVAQFPTLTERGPQPISGESALTQLLTSQDNGTLMRIAKSRGIGVTRESQLKPGIADSMLVRKIIDDFSPDELNEIGAKFMESTRFQHQFGNITPEAWHAMTMQYYFPDVKIPAAMMKRAQASIQANSPQQPIHPLAQAADDLTGILQQSLARAKGKQ